MNIELYKYYDVHTKDGVPFLNSAEFKYVTDKYGKQECRQTLAEYIASNQSKFPFTGIGYEEMSRAFHKLQKVRYEQYLEPSDESQLNNVLEKYDDYKYPYTKFGMGIIDCPSAPYNRASDYFMRQLRFNCNGFAHKGPIEIWENGTAKQIWATLGAMWRGINDVHFNEEGECISGQITVTSYSTVFRLGSYIATQFKPIVARSVYEMTNAKRILDTSMGWGDRLCGFFASSATEYIGCDPNPYTFENYKIMAETWSKLIANEYEVVENTPKLFILRGNKKSIHMYRSGAEDLPWGDIKDIDCAFTSPPYFSTEMYNEGGMHEEDQSWSKFNEYNKWRDDFYLPVAKNSFDSLSDQGFLITNIMDPKIKGTRYYSSDELVDHIGEEYFMGQMGMRIQQRPQGRHKFETPEELKEYLNKTYIENVWCFRKSPKTNNIDLFRDARKTNLDSFF
jgi:hypothetical protein